MGSVYNMTVRILRAADKLVNLLSTKQHEETFTANGIPISKPYNKHIPKVGSGSPEQDPTRGHCFARNDTFATPKASLDLGTGTQHT